MVEGGPVIRAAFVDRDGVINVERGYVSRIEDFELLPGAIAGLATLQSCGYAIVVVTNQAGIARGLYSEEAFHVLTSHLESTVLSAGVRLAGVYYCPHHPTEGVGKYHVKCQCRKPAPGMLLAAAEDLGLCLSKSVIVGDKRSDLVAGRAAHLKYCVLVRSGHPVSAEDEKLADACVDGLLEAARWVAVRTNSDQQPRDPVSLDNQ
jgi:D-glycero-D-manno-heptose 1,7-bisphosphate phosphatase